MELLYVKTADTIKISIENLVPEGFIRKDWGDGLILYFTLRRRALISNINTIPFLGIMLWI